MFGMIPNSARSGGIRVSECENTLISLFLLDNVEVTKLSPDGQIA